MENAKILIIEDDANSARLFFDLLTIKGAAASIVNNGIDALNKLATECFDLVILDLRLPGQNGFVIAEHIRNNAATKDLPIIVVSAFTDSPNKLRAYQTGANFVLHKPIDTTELLYVVNNLLKLNPPA